MKSKIIKKDTINVGDLMCSTNTGASDRSNSIVLVTNRGGLEHFQGVVIHSDDKDKIAKISKTFVKELWTKFVGKVELSQ